jgi:transposase
MRNGISITVSRPDRRRLQALVADRNVSQKHVWRAEIVLLTAEGLGTNEIMRRTAKSKTCVWRWQERFMEEGFEGLCRTSYAKRWLRKCVAASSAVKAKRLRLMAVISAAM